MAPLAAAQPSIEPLDPDAIPEVARPPGDLARAFTFRDAAGQHTVALSIVRSTRGADGDRPIEHAVVHLREMLGDELRVSRMRAFRCPAVRLEVGVAAPVLTDVDGDGLAELDVPLPSACGGRADTDHLAYEDGVDLLAYPRCGLGGDGALPASLRGSGLVGGVRARWRTVLSERVSYLGERAPSPAARPARRRAERGVPRAATATDAFRWRDRAGEHAFVVEETPFDRATGRWALTYSFHHRRGGRWVLDHETSLEAPCEDGDSTSSYDRRSATLTDWDGDGIDELSFLVARGCMTDYSPSDADFVVFEGTELHDVVGLTWTGDPHEPGECPLDPDLPFVDDPMRLLVQRLRP